VQTDIAQLRQWLSEPEGARLEFKEAKGSFEFDRLVNYCVALANEGGGKIILGVTDRRPRTILGTAAFAEPGRAEAGLHQRLSHRVPVEEILTDEGRVLVVHVPTRLPGTAWQIDGRYLKRAGDGLVALSDGELRQMFAETGPDFSAEVCPSASLADLSSAGIEAFRKRWAGRSRDDRKNYWSDEETLTNAESLLDGRCGIDSLRNERCAWAASATGGARTGVSILRGIRAGGRANRVSGGALSVARCHLGKGQPAQRSSELPGRALSCRTPHLRRGLSARGLDRKTNKALLLQHIQDNAATGARMEEFREVLPALSRSQIQVRLRELRDAEEIHSIGLTRAARWLPGPEPRDCNPEEPSR